jgi:hypothetical protein
VKKQHRPGERVKAGLPYRIGFPRAIDNYLYLVARRIYTAEDYDDDHDYKEYVRYRPVLSLQRTHQHTIILPTYMPGL